MKKRIFTFWEPKESCPAYINMCMQTWAKFLPEYEVVMVNYSNLHTWLEKDIIKKVLYKKMTLAKQADCLRVALLYTHGGMWLDADTILTENIDTMQSAIRLHGGGVAMIGMPKKDAHLAYIYASEPRTRFMELWLCEIYERMKVYKLFSRTKISKLFFRQRWKECKNWDYFGNSIIPSLIQELPSKDITVVDREKVGIFPEYRSSLYTSDIAPEELYRKFYFSDSSDFDVDAVIAHNKGVIMLHNSWTPEEFKRMSEQEFLRTRVPLAQMLQHILYS